MTEVKVNEYLSRKSLMIFAMIFGLMDVPCVYASPAFLPLLLARIFQPVEPDTTLGIVILLSLPVLVLLAVWFLYRTRRRQTASLERLPKREGLSDDVPPFSMVMLDNKGIIRGWSRAAEELLGYSNQEMIGKHVSILFTPEDRRACLPDWLMNRATSVRNAEAEAWRVRKDGTLFWGKILLSALHDASGRPNGFIEITQNVRRRESSDEQLRGSEQYLQRLLDTSLDMIIAVDKDRRIVEFNKAAQRQFGYSPEEVLGKYVNILYAVPEQGEQFRGTILEQGVAYLEVLNKRKSGETFSSIVSAGSIFDTQGEVIGVVGISRTVAPGTHSVEAIRSSEEMYRKLVEDINDVIFSVDRKGVITYISPAVERLGGFKPDELVGHPFIQFIHPDDLPIVKESFSSGMQNDPQPSEYRVIAKSGNLVWLRSFSRAIVEKGQVLGLRGVLTDITERKQAEESLQQRYLELQALYATSEAVNKCSDISQVYEATLDSLFSTLAVDRAAILLLDENKVSRFKAWRGLSEKYRWAVEGHFPWSIDETQPEPVLVEDARTHPLLSACHDLLRGEGIQSLAFLPLIDQGQLLGKFVLYYDTPHKFSQGEVQLAQAIASHVASAIHLKFADDSIHYRASVDSLIASISTAFINLTPGETDDEIHRTLQRIGAFTNADRSYVFRFDETNNTASNTHEWSAPSIEGKIKTLQNVPQDALGWWTGVIKSKNVIHLARLSDAPPEAEADCRLLHEQDIRSVVAIPLISKNSAVGFIGFDSVRRERTWDEETIRLLQMVADVLVNALERKESEGALHRSEQRYRDIVTLAPVGYYESSRSGLILDANARLAKMLGYDSSEEIVGLNLARDVYWNPADREALLAKYENAGRVSDYELLWKKKDGSPIWVLMNARAVESPARVVDHYEAFIQDITERKNTDRIMRESEERYRSVVTSVAEGIILLKSSGEIVACNASAERILHLSSQQLLGNTSIDRYWPALHEDGSPFPGDTHPPAETLRTGQPSSEVIIGLRKPDGTVTWISMNTEPLIKPGDEKPYAVVASFHDITNLRTAELSVKESEERYRDLVENISEGYIVTDAAGVILYTSPNVMEAGGYTREDIIGRNFTRFIEREDRRRVLNHYKHFVREGKTDTRCEFRALMKNKPAVWVEQVTRTIRRSDGSVQELRSVIRDISERRKSEETLRESEERYRLLAENSLDLIGLLAFDGKILYASPSHYHVLGYHAAGLVGRNLYSLVQPQFAHVIKDAFHTIIANAVDARIDIGLRTHNGGSVRVEANLSLFVGSGNTPDKILLTARDVSKQYSAIEALQKSEQHYRMLFERNLAGVYRSTLDGALLDCNESFVRIFGFSSREDAISHNVFENYFTEQERSRFLEQLIRERVIDNEEFHRRKIDGTPVWVMEAATLLKDDQGQFTIIEGTLVDITDRKVTYTALASAEAQYRQLVQSVQAIVWKADAGAQQFSFVSEEAESMLGFSVREWIQNPNFRRLHLHPDDRNMVMDEIAHASSNKHDFELEYRMISSAGQTVWVRDIARYVVGKEKHAQLVGVMIDITKQKQAEEKLRRSQEELRALSGHLESVREEERISVAREIHDELGQVLNALKMDLSLLGRKAYEAGDTVPLSLLMEELRSMKEKLDNTIQSVRKMVTELRPEVLDELGLRAAVEWQSHEFEARTQIRCTVDSNIDELSIEIERATAVFRIFQETLTNIARHARATQVNIKLVEDEWCVRLEVSDNGKGISENDKSRPGSIGLVGMRERALLLGGQVSVHGNAGSGTTVVVSIPKVEQTAEPHRTPTP